MQRWGCRDLVEGGAVDILNTDMSLAGGVTEWRRVAAHAASHRVQMAHHEEPLLSMHLLASPQGLYPEYFSAERDPVGAYLPTMAPLHQGWVELPETLVLVSRWTRHLCSAIAWIGDLSPLSVRLPAPVEGVGSF